MFIVVEKLLQSAEDWYFMRTSTRNQQAVLEKNDKTVRDGLSKVYNVNFDEMLSTQLALPTKMCGLGNSSGSFLARFLGLTFCCE